MIKTKVTQYNENGNLLKNLEGYSDSSPKTGGLFKLWDKEVEEKSCARNLLTTVPKKVEEPVTKESSTFFLFYTKDLTYRVELKNADSV